MFDLKKSKKEKKKGNKESKDNKDNKENEDFKCPFCNKEFVKEKLMKCKFSKKTN